MLETVAAVFFANGMTMIFIYGMYRLVKRDTDGYGIMCVLVLLFAAGLIAIALTEQHQSETTFPASHAAAAEQ